MADNLRSLDWSKPIRKRFSGKSFWLGEQALRITGQNQLWIQSAPQTGLLINGLIHGSGSLALNVDVSLVSDGPSSFKSGSAIENHGMMTAASLIIRATISGAYNSVTSGVANHGIMRNVQSIYAEDMVDGVGIFNSGIISGFNSSGYQSSITGKAYGLNRFGIGILNRGTIQTGGLLKGSGVTGISNYGMIDFESSAVEANWVVGDGWSTGIDNFGTIKGSMNRETLIGTASSIPNWNSGIINSGRISLEGGNDRIIASGGRKISIIPKPPFDFSPDLINTGTINMGEGNDRIDVSENGIAGATGQVGRVEMGGGNDVFIGFGDDQIISGGDGIDTLRLPAGTYTFTPSNFPLTGAMEVSAAGASLILTEYERVGLLGAANAIPFPVAGGTLTF
jgi:hypothetical protein